jgi:hypothetical protein
LALREGEGKAAIGLAVAGLRLRGPVPAGQNGRMLRLPLLRLLTLNMAIGVVLALLMLAGLLLVDDTLRALMLADRTALALLAFGLIITFCSAAMGSAVMALGRRRD